MTTGLVVSSYGRNFIVEVENKPYHATTKSKKNDYVVGDIVNIEQINDAQVQIINVHSRKNLIFRTDQNRSKIIASNVTQLLIVIAIKPNFNVFFLNSCLICAESQEIQPIIIINKIDLPESIQFIKDITQLYAKQLDYKIIELSAINNCTELVPLLPNNTSLLIGQSGVGKSTITNKIIPEANTRTREITKSETSGSHTTTNTSLYHINNNAALIDCPGLHEFGLYHLEIDSLARYFPEFRDYIGECKFRNCRHINEPNCAILNATKLGLIDQQRLNYFQQLSNKLLTKPTY